MKGENVKIQSVTGVVLAGGKSERMGVDKASLVIGQKMMIEHVVYRLKGIFSQVMVVTKDHSFGNLGVRICKDLIHGSGALVGIYSALKEATTQHCFVVACDMPYLEPALVKWMVKSCGDFDAFVPKIGSSIEPLFAVYSKGCLEHIARRLAAGDYRVRGFFQDVNTGYASEKDIRKIDPELRSFTNINTRSQLQSVIESNGGGK